MSATTDRSTARVHRTSFALGDDVVPYAYGDGCTDELVSLLGEELRGADRVVLVHDAVAEDLARRVADGLAASRPGGLPVAALACTAREDRKTLGTVLDLAEQAVAGGATRGSTVVALGGGLVGNVAGMVAATLFRGLPLVHLPTTPVAAFDAVLSAKQGVNLSAGKNMVGTFWTPASVWCDLGWLRGVDARQLLTGTAEMAKNVLAVLPDREEDLRTAVAEMADDSSDALARLLQIGVDAKAPLLAADPHERREALVFEYGHTVGHAVELASRGALSHGASVGWGMLVAAEVAQRLGHLDGAAVDAHARVLAPLGVREEERPVLDRALVHRLLLRDNKRGYLPGIGDDVVPMVLLGALGRPLVDERGRPLMPVPTRVVHEAVDAVLRPV
ncbi:iron-containing alcohol dehydrogenase [Pseudokineococcus basanitobsidens]|uniref:Iron-containing alcohol dehydrogenase n=1 Tax=Pseudokineococcus basanitobsidens TaxID=1926649 RepID=A0ABU8RFY2_9ACTN